MPYRVVAPDSDKSRFVQLLPLYTMWGYLYPDTDTTGTVRGLATPTPPQAKKGMNAPSFGTRIVLGNTCTLLYGMHFFVNT
jgi:hypothetical protein